MPPNRQYVPTQSEYDALPPALKRKCFSTLERLRYAEGTTQPDNELQPIINNNNSNPNRVALKTLRSRGSIAKLRKKTGPINHHTTIEAPEQPSETNPSFLPGSAYTIASATRENEQWFACLPDKVKRAYFSVEEEHILDPRHRKVVAAPVEEHLYPLTATESQQSLPTLEASSTGPSSPNYSTANSKFSDDEEEEVEEDLEDMDDEMMSHFNWVDEEVDLTLDDYHKIISASKASSKFGARVANLYGMRPSLSVRRKAKSEVQEPVKEEVKEEIKTAVSSPRPVPILKPAPILRPAPIPPFPKSRQGGVLNPREKLNEWGSGWAPVPIPPVPEMPETAVAQTVHCRKASIVTLPPRKSTSSSRLRANTGPTPVATPTTTPTATAVPTTLPTPASSIKRGRSPVREASEKWGSSWAPDTIKAPPTPPSEPVSALESHAAHYLDPEARMKLRVYLASPSKFDEALEFGFPSLIEDKSETVSLKSSKTPISRKASSPELRTKPTPASITTDSPLTSNLTTTSAPAKPEFISIPYTSLTNPKPQSEVSTPNSEIKAQLRKLDRDPNIAATGREMTIRMTLTRPDLRADDSLLYPQSQGQNKNVTFVGKRPTVSHVDSANSVKFEMLRLDEAPVSMPVVQGEGKKGLGLRRLWGR